MRTKQYVKTINPTLAQSWLKKADPKGRNVNQGRVKQFAADMVADRWSVNGETIKFDIDDVLIDGHHRLEACILANKSFKSWVIEGLEKGARLTIDTGAPRSPKDVLNMDGVPVTLAHVGTIVPFISGGNTGMREDNRLSPSAQAEIYAQHKNAIDFAVEVAPQTRQQVRAVIARAFYTADHDALKRFAELVKNGYTESGVKSSENAALKLRTILEKHRGVHSTRSARELYQTVESALQSFLEGKQVVRLRASKEELFPIPTA